MLGASKGINRSALPCAQCLNWVKSYPPIEPIAPPDVGCCSKIGHGFASQRKRRYGPNSDKVRHSKTSCFDHFVSAYEQRRRDRYAQCLGGL